MQNGDIKNSKILLVIVVCLGSLTFINSRSYSNPVTYYDAVILQNPHSAFAYNNRGLLKSLHADELGATQDYEKAIAINSDYFDAYYNNGCAKAKLGDNPGAIENYNKLLHSTKNQPEPLITGEWQKQTSATIMVLWRIIRKLQ